MTRYVMAPNRKVAQTRCTDFSFGGTSPEYAEAGCPKYDKLGRTYRYCVTITAKRVKPKPRKPKRGRAQSEIA